MRRRRQSELRYVIWSFEHDGWWKPGGMGYTPYLTEAGRYTQTAAEAIVAHANQFSRLLQEVTVPEREGATLFPSWTCPVCLWVTSSRHHVAQRYCQHCAETGPVRE